jgi:phosphatidylserine/phosphatidylglycerophosphate/cardiolipin synthase-like enzyme
MALSWWPEKQGLITLFGGSNVTTVVAFSPKQGASNLVIQTIKGANKYVYVAAYYFTYQPIADALGEAHDTMALS